MKRYLVWVIGIIIGIYLLYSFFVPTYAWNQKITVVVSTPKGEISGSAVSYVRWADGIKILPDPSRVTSSTEGEATVVDLGEGRYLFALIDGNIRRALGVFNKGRLGSASAILESAREVTLHYNETIELHPKRYPILVTFENLAKPETVKEVKSNDLATHFGEGYSLKSIALEVTNEPVTKGRVEKVLMWMSSVAPNRLDGRRYTTIYASNRFANSLSPYSFSTSIDQ